MADTEPEKALSRIRKMSCKKLFRERWRGPDVERLDVYPGSELYKQHMKGVIDEAELFKNNE